MKRKGPSAAQRNFIFSEQGYCSCDSQRCKEKAAVLRACESQKSPSFCCVHSRASTKPKPGCLAHPSSPGPVVSAWGSTAWGGTYVCCVLSEALGDWNEPRISSFLLFFFSLCKSIHSRAVDGIWHCLTFHFFIEAWPQRGCVRKPDAGMRSGLESFLSPDTEWLSTFLSS